MSPLLALLATSPLHAETLPPGAVIDEALSATVSKEGLDAIGGLASSLVPGDLPVDDIAQSVDLLVCEPGIWMSNIRVDMALSYLDITPVSTGAEDEARLDIEAGLDIAINDPVDRFSLLLDYCLGDSDCPGYVEPFPVTVRTSLSMKILEDAEGNPTMDATLGELSYELGLDASNDLKLDCGIQTLEEVLGYLGISLYDFVFDLAVGQLDSTLGDLTAELEPAIEDAFAAASYSDEVELLDGVSLSVQLFPSAVRSSDTGLQLVFGGALDAPASECVAAYDPGGFQATESALPEPTGAAHLEAALADEFANQALYALWRSGLLCYDLDDLQGLSLDTSLLGLLAGDAFDTLFEEAAPITMSTRPRKSPVAVYGGESDIGVAVEDLGLDIYAEIDGRSARVLGLDLGLDLGVDLDFDDSTGELGVLINLDPERFDVGVGANEYAPGTDPDIAENFAGVFDSFVGPLIDGLVGDSLAFALPAFEGVGLTDLDIHPEGEYGDWLGLDAIIGETTYGLEGGLGCDEDGNITGCESGGCGGGCSSAGGRSRVMLFLFPLALAFVRRRRR